MRDISTTVIVCTYNRCHVLPKALHSIAASALPSTAEWEVLVVDNNSTDQTRQVVEDFCRLYPGRFRYLFEPCQGKSNALNTGIRVARGDVLVFTDDDVVVEPGWLLNLTAPLRNGEWAGVCGRIIPMWERPIPPWLRLDGPYASAPFVSLDLGPCSAPLTGPTVGANMAFQKWIFERHGGFRTDLGRCGGSLRACEDTELGRRLQAAGERLLYEPSAVVHHPVPAIRMTKKYLLRWRFWHAVSEVGESGHPPHTGLSLAGVPLYLFVRLGRWTLQWMVSIKPASRFSCKLAVWHLSGTIVGCRRLVHGTK